jgi:hypothetical protein
LLYVIALLTILGSAPVPSANAQSGGRRGWTSPEEFRAEYLKFLGSLSARVPASDRSSWAVELRHKISDIRVQVEGLPDSTLEQFSKMTDRDAFTRMAVGVATGTRKDLARTELDVVSAPVPQSPIQPPDSSGAVAGTTCSTTPTDAGTLDGEKIGLYVDKGLQVPLDYACETIVEILGEGTNAPFCIAAAIAKAVEVVLDSLIDHQEFCNGLLDGAKVDATLSDVENIHADVGALDTHLTNVDNQITSEFGALDTHLTNVNDQITGEFTAVDTHLTNVDNHVANEFAALDAHVVTLFSTLGAQLTGSTDLLSAGLKQVMKLELTPEGRRQIAPAILTCTGTNCPDVLAACTGAGGVCSWNNVGPLP